MYLIVERASERARKWCDENERAEELTAHFYAILCSNKQKLVDASVKIVCTTENTVQKI